MKPHPILPGYYADETQRRRFLTRMFNETATHYDRINGIMAFGWGIWYRRWILRRVGLRPGARLLDVAVGTGAVAGAAVRIVGSPGRVVGIDPSPGMLAEARRKLPIPLVQGLAEQLPFRAGQFDFVSMGYALRHVSDLKHTFGEYVRVLRPGGTLLILDFACPRSRLGRGLGRLHVNHLGPLVARLLSRRREAQTLMRYCWDTVEHLVPADTILTAMANAGFEVVNATVRFGLLSEYLGRTPSHRGGGP
ncbi:MAG TPA: class I SAM-dependent methyltransferase [Methylomirabilota bacterium]|nr:class I SAM-dependent methyltransferase [Methylomirabilota bacterium]